MGRRLLQVVLATATLAALLVLGRGFFHGQPSLQATSFKLGNGLDVETLLGDCGDEAAIALLINVGEDHDPPGQSGLAVVIARLLATRAPGLHVQSTRSFTLLSLTSPATSALDELDTVARLLADPGITEEALAAARQQVLADIGRRRGEDAALTAATDAAEAVLPSPGQGRRGGVAAEVERIGVSEVTAFWKAHLTAATARLVVVGSLDPEKTKGRIEQAFGKLPAGTPPVARAPRDMTVTGTIVMGDAPAAIAVAIRAPAIREPTFAAFLVHAARLMQSAPGGNDWSVSYDPLMNPELLLVTGPLRTGEQPEAGASRIQKALGDVVARPMGNGDIEAAAKRFAPFLGVELQSPVECAKEPAVVASALARRAQLDLQQLPLARSVEAVTQAQMTEAAALYAANRAATVVAGGVVR